MSTSPQILDHIQDSIQALLEGKAGGDLMFFTGSQQEAIPTALFLDPTLRPVDRNLWVVLRLSMRSQGGRQAAFPSYEDLESLAGRGSKIHCRSVMPYCVYEDGLPAARRCAMPKDVIGGRYGWSTTSHRLWPRSSKSIRAIWRSGTSAVTIAAPGSDMRLLPWMQPWRRPSIVVRMLLPIPPLSPGDWNHYGPGPKTMASSMGSSYPS